MHLQRIISIQTFASKTNKNISISTVPLNAVGITNEALNQFRLNEAKIQTK